MFLTSLSLRPISATISMVAATGRRSVIIDADDNGTQTGLNPSLILQGDLTVQRIYTAIKASKVWRESRSAIVILWDENDYSTITPNQVVTVVETNYGRHKVRSLKYYDHYSSDQDARLRRSACRA